MKCSRIKRRERPPSVNDLTRFQPIKGRKVSQSKTFFRLSNSETILTNLPFRTIFLVFGNPRKRRSTTTFVFFWREITRDTFRPPRDSILSIITTSGDTDTGYLRITSLNRWDSVGLKGWDHYKGLLQRHK